MLSLAAGGCGAVDEPEVADEPDAEESLDEPELGAADDGALDEGELGEDALGDDELDEDELGEDALGDAELGDAEGELDEDELEPALGEPAAPESLFLSAPGLLSALLSALVSLLGEADGVEAPAALLLALASIPSLAIVSESSRPLLFRPSLLWKSRSAAWVFGPILPSTSPGS